MRTMVAVASVIAVLCGFAARAEDSASPPDPHLAAAVELLELTNAKTNMMTMVDAITPVILGQARKTNPKITDAIARQFQTVLREEITADLDDLMKLQATLYEQHFTIEELHALSDFYRSEVGKKYISTLPVLIKESVPLGAAWGREVGVRAAQRATERLRANGVDI